ncbi:hypothetical protein A2914_02285 [Candidatus Nomurabacteria bacterium RIFCSPLOWO2_01_FULL_41_21]|uniref:Uncharacterized protein n=2 Tax=Candidatus Nomuraibacteriota TaxID=1752729 RepID=A0A1F6V2M1_9BACT|nr:MAG: hypothetical protein A2733_01675 [Candidatus Nomurabacteria bacterium RIFCSPHIGHO2_01_FULL_40_20]OGI88754.1 MAG: hypothetical protein A2914_02285 [Candidatus Nomurabacteria bacterium RIFCSPLOWO2_01_FULL_41_21]
MKINRLSSKILFLFLLSFLVFSPIISLAQLDINVEPPSSNSIKIKNPIKINSIVEFLKEILKAVIKIGIPLIVLAIIYSGFLFVTAMGNPEKLTKAKDALLWSLVGAAVLLGAWAIAELIVTTIPKLE